MRCVETNKISREKQPYDILAAFIQEVKKNDMKRIKQPNEIIPTKVN